MAFISEIENLKIIYKEIIEGYSLVDGVFIKHLDEIENIEVVAHKLSLYEKYIKDGISSVEDKLKFLIESGQWTLEKEDEIVSLSQQIIDNESNLHNIISQQQGRIKKVIEALKIKKAQILIDKQNLLGQTANFFAERDSFNYLVYVSLYKDLKNRMFDSYTEFQELDDLELIKYSQILEGVLEKITHQSIRQIACMPFFINPFSYSKENIYYFLGKPLSRLTHYQSSLLSLGSRNLNTLANIDVEPPELTEANKLDDITVWYDQQHSILLGKKRSGR